MNELLKKVLASEVRRFLATAAGSLVTIGIIAPEQVTPFIDSVVPVVVGALLYIGIFAWGLMKNLYVQKIENIASDAAPLAVYKAKGKL